MTASEDSLSSGKVKRYEEFLNNVLREDLRKVLNDRDKVTSELAEYIQLETMLEKLIEDPEMCSATGMTTKVDLGCNFYVNAKVQKTQYICVNIGFGFFVELTFQEGLTFVLKKIKLLECRLEQLTKDSALIKTRIKLVLEGLREIQGISNETDVKNWVFDI